MDNEEYIEPTKPRVRIRTNLTTIQIDKEQKETIDQAYNLFMAEGIPTTKGEFLEGLALEFMRRYEPKIK